MGKKKKIALILLCGFIVVLGLIATSYAFFNYSSLSNITITTNVNNETIVEVASFKQLFTCGKADFFDDNKKVSTDTSRKIIKFTNDVTLGEDLYITADVYIDLNGHTLDLNDHALTFKHGYDGAFSMYNGTLEVKDSGYLCVDLVNATFVPDSLTVKKNGVAANLEDHIELVSLNAKYTAYSAFYYAINNISSSIAQRVDFADYTTVLDDGFTFTLDKFIYNKYCSFSSENESCAFIYKDVDFKYNYLSSDIVISYASSNQDVLSNYGNYTPPTTSEQVTLTITVNSPSLSIDQSIDVPVHVVNLAHNDTKFAVGEALIKEYLTPYYKNKALGTIFDDYYYYFSNMVTLPVSAFDGLITYSYDTTNLAGEAVSTTSKVQGNAFLFDPNEDCYYLLVTINDQVNPLRLNMYSTSIGDYKTVAWLIINQLYGGSIIFDSTESRKDLYSFADISTNLATKDLVEEFNITGVSYAIKPSSEAENHYTLSNNSLQRIEDAPVSIKTSSITMTLNYTNDEGAPESISVDLFVQYLDATGESLSNFLPYYSAYDSVISTTLTSTLEMPFAYEQGTPYTCYDFVTVFSKEMTTINGDVVSYYDYYNFNIPSCLTVSLYYDGAKRLVFNDYIDNQSLTTQLDAYLAENSLKLSDIAAYADAKYLIEIDPDLAMNVDQEVVLIYNYKFANTDWNKYVYIYETQEYQTELTISKFTVSGGLYFDETGSSLHSNAIYDANFFVWIYNNYKPSGDNITTADASDLIIPISWLEQEKEIDIAVDATLNAVNSFHGIGNLSKVSKINLSGKNITTQVIQGISTLDSLTTLKLVGCGLTDISSLQNLTSVKSLDISNNNIQYFDSLVPITSLEEVYLYDNNSNNNYYGSLGICNSQAFVDLMRNGTSVYNSVSSGIPVLFAESDSINDYKRLKQIAYQDKLSKNVSIANLYSGFSTIYSDYNLTTNGTLTWGYEGDSNDPAGENDSSTVYNASYFYVKYTFSGYSLVVKYHVDRY